jgi:hypothetical protein
MSEKKTLLPELLPAPTSTSRPHTASATAPSPVERVAEQARLILQRFRGLGPVAGAAMLGLHGCGYGVVDPLPPPPVQCTTLPMPFSSIVTTASVDSAADGGAAAVLLHLSGGGYPGVLGLRIDAVRVTGATLLGEMSAMSSNPRAGSEFVVTIAPDASMSAFLVDIDLGCGAATTTKHYRLTYSAPGWSVAVLPTT